MNDDLDFPVIADVELKQKPTRTLRFIAIVALTLITGGAVGVLAYASVIQSSENALTTIGLIATTGLGALISIIAGKAEPNDVD